MIINIYQRILMGKSKKQLLLLFLSMILMACGDKDQDPLTNLGLNSQQNMKADLVVAAGKSSEVQLQANQSSLSEVENITYEWEILTMPENSQAVLSDATSNNPVFTADLAGMYVTRLDTLSDGSVISSSDIVVKALPMVAYPEPDQLVKTGATVTLNEQIMFPPFDDIRLITDPSLNPNTGNYKVAAAQSPYLFNDEQIKLTESQPMPSDDFLTKREGTDFLIYESTSAELPPDINSDQPIDSAGNIVGIEPINPIDNIFLPEPSEISGINFLEPSGEFLPNGLILTWSFISIPEGSSAVISDINAISPTFVADVSGKYEVNMEVDDGIQKTSAIITVVAYDFKAMAGYDSAVAVDHMIQLDGSESWTTEGNLSYQWSFASIPSGSSAVLTHETAANPTFVADIEGTYVVELEVSNGSNTDIDTVAITAFVDYNVGIDIRAYAGPDQDVKTGLTVELSGNGSGFPSTFGFPENVAPGIEPAIALVDASGLTYNWTFVSLPDESDATFSDASLITPNFIADKPGEYIIKLEVSDDTLTSSDIVVVTAHNIKSVIHSLDFVFMGQEIQLDGSNSWSINGDLIYQWTLNSIPVNSETVISDTDIPNPTMKVDVEGIYEVSLTVDDGITDVKSTRLIYVMPDQNIGLIEQVYAGPDQLVKLGDTVMLEGINHQLPGNTTDLIYTWRFKSIPPGSTAKIAEPNSISTGFVADKEGDYIVVLEGHDALHASIDEVIISAHSMKAMAGYDQYVQIDTLVELDGQHSWNLSGSFTYQWQLISAPITSNAELTNSTSSTAQFVPDVDGSYTVELIISDADRKDKDTVIIRTAFDNDPGGAFTGITATTRN